MLDNGEKIDTRVVGNSVQINAVVREYPYDYTKHFLLSLSTSEAITLYNELGESIREAQKYQK